MFKVGEFSKLSQVSVKTLRYYDELGLLKPSQVDKFTSYRYYNFCEAGTLQRCELSCYVFIEHRRAMV